MNVLSLFRRPAVNPPERAAYEAIVAAARHPVFYENFGVPDTVDGRLDMIILHVFLVLDRLRGGEGDFPQRLVDEMFRDMDRSMREMGTSDPAVPKKVRRIAEVYAGRIAAYGRSLDDSGAFKDALLRNVFAGGQGDAESLMRYCEANRSALSGQKPEDLQMGHIVFREPSHEAD